MSHYHHFFKGGYKDSHAWYYEGCSNKSWSYFSCASSLKRKDLVQVISTKLNHKREIFGPFIVANNQHLSHEEIQWQRSKDSFKKVWIMGYIEKTHQEFLEFFWNITLKVMIFFFKNSWAIFQGGLHPIFFL